MALRALRDPTLNCNTSPLQLKHIRSAGVLNEEVVAKIRERRVIVGAT